jgi:outer membrane protein assembly factor BamB
MLHRYLFVVAAAIATCVHAGPATRPAGDWPEPRQNAFLTSIQTMPGASTSAPKKVGEIDLGRSTVSVTPATLRDGTPIGLAIVGGELLCYRTDGSLKWRSHPAGLNFAEIKTCEDINGDGKVEIALQAGRPAQPYGAACLVSADDGSLIWRYDVDPMSYAWYLHVGNYLPHSDGKQIAVIMHGYPPDKQNGYIALFDFPKSAKEPQQKWRYDFDQYTCFPSFLQADLDGDGVDELMVETHSKMWCFDAPTGKVKQFIQWDTSPANIRSYGLTQFVDLNGDGRKDFLCIANFAQHHEVLLNENGKLKEAWHHGWPESVTTGTVATCYPLPAYGDVDGDGKTEIVLSMFNADNKAHWVTRALDAVTGEVKYECADFIASTLADVDGDGALEVIGDFSTDSAAKQADGGHVITPHAGAGAFKAVRDGKTGAFREIWRDKESRAVRSEALSRPHVERDGKQLVLELGKDKQVHTRPFVPLPAPKPPTFKNLPAIVGEPLPELLAADVAGDHRNELLIFRSGKVAIYSMTDPTKSIAEYPTSCLPAVGDFDGDGKLDLALADAGENHPPTIRIVAPSQDGKVIWEAPLPEPKGLTLPSPRVAYLRTAHFTGRKTPDLYAWFGTPAVRSVAIDGTNGKPLWELFKRSDIERYSGPSTNLASVFDFNSDGHDDLVFTDPDYFCVASGIDGSMLLGPLYPPNIFSQPSQGLYTLPAILPQQSGRPKVAIVDGHYFQGVMSIDGKADWYHLPVVGENRASAEGFAQLPDGKWLMGVGRQNGKFGCINISDGSTRWDLDVQATCSDIIACDINGDGRQDFLFGTSHGKLYAVTDNDGKPQVLWTVDLGTGSGNPIAADVDGDGKSEIIVPTLDGHVTVLK